MRKGQGTQHVLFQDHGDIWDEISYGSLILFAIYRKCPKKSKKKDTMINEYERVDFIAVLYVMMSD
jgi:hypothetical protein